MVEIDTLGLEKSCDFAKSRGAVIDSVLGGIVAECSSTDDQL